ncbi:MAG: hypothetical protein R2911_03680 [Caldilineaceae bacterium]
MTHHTELEVILTHEHSDFDALASLLGASLLYPNALPVLPRRINSNVRFLWMNTGTNCHFIRRRICRAPTCAAPFWSIPMA